MPVGRRSSVWTSHSCSSLRRIFSPAPPSNSTLSGTTTAARPWILSIDFTCWTKFSCLLRRRRPEVRPVVGDGLLVGLALVVDDGDATTSCRTAGSSARRRRVSTARSAAQSSVLIGGFRRVVVGADAVQEQVHRAEARDAVDQLDAAQGVVAEVLLLVLVELVVLLRGSRAPRAGSRRCRRPGRR